MYYGIIILATALLLSLTAEYYSIMGLTAIFAAAVVPVIVMGASLGLGKVVATVWCHNNWKRIPLSFKLYLVPAIIFLMLLTSMGIFGYLSKAHLDQANLTGDSTAQVALFDEKIKTQKDNIESARLALKQMDATVDQTIARSTDAGSVQIASQLRKRQQKERADLQNEIGTAQIEIAKLQEQRAPLAAQSRKIEAEVGPIKYIAALIYGDNPDANLLERAVRWVIILIVMVFDPLALCLILAASLQFAWARHGSGGFVHDDPDNGTPSTVPASEAIVQDPAPFFNGEMAGLPIIPEESIPPMPYVVPPAPVMWTTTTTYTEPELVLGEEEDDLVEEIFEMPSEWESLRHAFVEEQPLTETLTDPVVAQAALEAVFADRPEYFKPVEEKLAELDAKIEEGIAHFNDEPVEGEFSPELLELADAAIATIEEASVGADEVLEDVAEPDEEIVAISTPIPQIPDLLNITDDAPAPPKMVEVITEHIDPNTRIRTFEHNWVPETMVADNVEDVTAVKADFGTIFPPQASKGDMYLRVDYLPTRLFKFNGLTWMQIDKTASDSYTYNEEYVKYLIAKIDSGEYSLDDLTEAEQNQLAEYLKNE